MLPTKLILSAFGSYPGRTEIPLEKLGRRGVYLITGETGAGKSTIFDAITFALYDTASGGKDKQLLRSQYAEPDTPTFVDLYFDHKDVHYRFLRYLPPKSGGKLPPGAKELRVFTVDDDNIEKCINLNYKIKENKALVNEILGVDYEQFRQVAMLAQGDFFRLVETKSSERRAIFSTIFDTSVFARIEEAAREENRLAAEKVSRKADELRACIDALTENTAHAEELTEIKQDALAAVLTADCTARAIAAAEAITAEDANELDELKKGAEKLHRAISEQQTMISKAEEAAKAKAELEKAVSEKKQLEEGAAAAEAELEKAASREHDIKAFRETAAVEEKTLPKYRKLTKRTAELHQTEAKLSAASETHEKTKQELARLRSSRTELTQKLETLASAEQELAEASHALEKAEARSNAAFELSESFTAMKKSRRNVTSAQETYIAAQRSAIDHARGYLSVCMAATHSAQQEYDSLENERKKNELEIKKAEAELELLTDCEAELAKREAEHKKLSEQLEKLTALRNISLPRCRTEQSTASAHYKKLVEARENKHRCEELYNSLSDAYHQSAAWKLTTELEDGKPCPVCGSLHHPAPAKKPPKTPDKAEVDAARAELELAEKKYEELDRAQQALDKKTEAVWAVVKGEALRLTGKKIENETAEQTLDESINIQREKTKVAEASLNAVNQAVVKKRVLQAALAEGRSSQQRISGAITGATRALGERKTLCESVTESFLRMTAELPERAERCTGGGEVKLKADIGSLFDTRLPADIYTCQSVSDGELSAKKAQSKYALSESDSALNSAYNAALSYSARRSRFAEQFRRHFGSEITGRAANAIGDEIAQEQHLAGETMNNAKSAELQMRRRVEEKSGLAKKQTELETLITSAEAKKSSLEAQLSRLEEAAQNGANEVAALKKELSYENEQLVTEHIARLRADADAMQRDIDNARGRTSALAERISRLDGNISQLEKRLNESPAKEADAQQLKETLNELITERKNRDSLMIELNTRLKSNSRLLKKLQSCEKARAQAQEEADMVSLLYRTMAGTVSGKEKLDLETFVQLHYFDTVIANANVRLKFMTNGQYELKRRGSAGDLRSRFGLDLNIVDYFCADPEKQERDVTSISGGEKFKVSLALALGLSDEIMRRAGAVRFDTLFVDEGFGSLDSDSLQLALDVLDELSSADDRLIGIISHVEALKQSIDRQIVVKKNGGEGSRIEIR